MFREEYPKKLDEMNNAITTGDAYQLNRSAHYLKGLVATFGSHLAQQSALKLELMGDEGDLTHGLEEVAVLSSELDRLNIALIEFASS